MLILIIVLLFNGEFNHLNPSANALPLFYQRQQNNLRELFEFNLFIHLVYVKFSEVPKRNVKIKIYVNFSSENVTDTICDCKC